LLRFARPFVRPFCALLLAGVAAAAISGCAVNSSQQSTMEQPDFSGMGRADVESSMLGLAESYEKRPRDKGTIIYYAAALRAAGQAEQATSVLEAGIGVHPQDVDIRLAYAKALTAAGRFEEALAVVDGAIRPDVPDWNAMLVKGAVLDQMGRNAEARQVYEQAQVIAPGEPSLEANLGLSYAMTNELASAESHLRRAVQMPGATSQIRQNLALVLGLQGRLEESRAIYAAELSPDQVEANLSYIRALLTQQNRWELIEGDQG
jgi:Flp pilus assembly protein TadD